MVYNQLKQLRGAGFEVPSEQKGEWLLIRQAGGGTDRIYEPTLQELVDACGEHFTEIRNVMNLQKRAVHPMDIPPERRYEAVSTNGPRLKYGHGATMEEALANLYLAIKNPVFHL